jgi:Putative transposase
VLDGVYRTNARGEPEFVETPPPSEEQVWEVLQSIIKRVMKQLVRQGILVEDQGETYLADTEDESEEARALRPLHRGSCVYRIAFGPRAGQKVLTLQGALPKEASGKQRLCANLQGFGLHAAVRCGAGQRKTLERLCRYITRPALANDRVQINAAGQVELKLKSPWRAARPIR